jgi:hypothetical protein
MGLATNVLLLLLRPPPPVNKGRTLSDPRLLNPSSLAAIIFTKLTNRWGLWNKATPNGRSFGQWCSIVSKACRPY